MSRSRYIGKSIIQLVDADETTDILYMPDMYYHLKTKETDFGSPFDPFAVEESIWSSDLIPTTNSSPPTTLKGFMNIYYRRTIIVAVYTAGELTAAFGKSSASLSGMRFYVVTQPLNQPLPDYAIGIKEGTFSTTANPGNTGYTVVKNQASESFTSGTTKEFQFDQTFNWSGNDIAIVCAWGQCPVGYNASGVHPTGAGNTYYQHSDAAGAFRINIDAHNSASTGRPVIQLYG